MNKEEFDRLSLDDKEDLCREDTFVMTIQHIGQTLNLYFIADGQLCQMQDLAKFFSAIDVKDTLP